MRLLYWGVTGALIGYGFIAIFSIGLPFVVVGLALIVVGANRLGPRFSWAAVIGFGLLPALALLYDLLASGPPCPKSGRLTAGQHCIEISGYRGPVIVFGAIAVVGLVLGLVMTRAPLRR